MKKELIKVSTPTIAMELKTIQAQKEAIEVEEKRLKGLLIKSLKEQHVKSVRLEDGTIYTRSHRETLKAKDEAKAMEWATQNFCLKIDTTRATKILRRAMKLPKFFQFIKGEEYLTVSQAK